MDETARLVRRYLGAFGPAHRRDIATWAGVKVRDVAPALDRLELRSFRAEDGDELVDLPRAPLPDPGHRRRCTSCPPGTRRCSPTAGAPGCFRSSTVPRSCSTKNPFSLGTVLVDGEVRATWRPLEGRIEVTELDALGRAARTAVADEADRWRRSSRECDLG